MARPVEDEQVDRAQQPPHQSSFCPFKDIPRWREHQIYANDPEPTRREQPLEKAEREHVMWRDVEDRSIPRTQPEELSNPAGKSAPRMLSIMARKLASSVTRESGITSRE